MLYLVSAEYRGWRLGGVYILKKGLLVCRRAVLSWVTVSYSCQCSLFQYEKLWPNFILLRLEKNLRYYAGSTLIYSFEHSLQNVG